MIDTELTANLRHISQYYDFHGDGEATMIRAADRIEALSSALREVGELCETPQHLGQPRRVVSPKAILAIIAKAKAKE